MSIINGSLDRRTEVLSAGNLTVNPFTRTEPSEDVIDRVFVGRSQQIREAAFRVLDRPRNLLVTGGFGLGKTTFIRKLLRELQGSQKIRFLTGYAPLRSDTPQGLQLAALSALAEGALLSTPPGSELHSYARDVQEELSRVEGGTTESLRVPDIRFREGLKLANAMFRRVVIAIDEIDKRDPQTVQSIVMGSRYFLDLEASFILTGRFLDAFSDIRASLLAAFDHRIELEAFTPEECEEILRRNLQIAREVPEPAPTLRPFQREVVDAITQRANGLPRPLNLMADAALEQAVWDAVEAKVEALEVTLPHLEKALGREGNLVFNKVGVEAREMLARIFQRNGYVAGAELDMLSPKGGQPEAIRTLDDLTRQDAVLRLSATEGPAFALTPTVKRTLEQLQTEHERLQSLWRDVTSATDAHTRGKALEEFAEAFFEMAFKVVERNARTDTEELDLVLERSSETDVRFHDSYFVVECKNWRSKPVDQPVVSALLGKMQTRRRTQAFLLTSGEFTEDAKQQAAYAFTAAKVEIILIAGQDIEGFLLSLRTVSDFLAELHRKQVMLRRFTR
jgi:type II secretory pathway predicted ATPase ExeA/Holliday junction resolvase-like predicted endonuclease